MVRSCCVRRCDLFLGSWHPPPNSSLGLCVPPGPSSPNAGSYKNTLTTVWLDINFMKILTQNCTKFFDRLCRKCPFVLKARLTVIKAFLELFTVQMPLLEGFNLRILCNARLASNCNEPLQSMCRVWWRFLYKCRPDSKHAA